MKNCCLFVIMFFFCVSGMGQKLAVNIPQSVLASFVRLHPEVKKQTWLAENHRQFAAEFFLDGAPQTIVFDSAGKVLRIRSEILVQENLPAFLQDSLRRYKAMDFVRAIRTETPGSGVVFDVDVAQNRLIVTKRFSQANITANKKAVKHSP